MFERYALQGSSFAGDIDNLILMILFIVGPWFLLAEGVFFWLMFKFREKPGVKSQYITGEAKHEKKWITIPHMAVLAFDLFIIYGAINVWVTVKQTQPPADETVKVIAQQWAWTYVHPGPDGKLDTADDIRTVDDFHFEVNKTYHFLLESKDVLHSFSIPAFRLKQDTIPGRTIVAWAKPTKTGTFDLQCAEICGIGHGIMRAQIVVETADVHAAWIRSHGAVAQAAPAPAPEPAKENEAQP